MDAAEDVVVLTDAEMWSKVVFNLVANAVKYTPAGRVSVRLVADENTVRLVVTDTGLGIPTEDLLESSTGSTASNEKARTASKGPESGLPW